jgi:hypothetical protein
VAVEILDAGEVAVEIPDERAVAVEIPDERAVEFLDDGAMEIPDAVEDEDAVRVHVQTS